jgi:hypothetical protein
MMKTKRSHCVGIAAEVFCAVCSLFVFPVWANPIYPGDTCIWSIPSRQISVPSGWCVSEAILTIRNVSIFDGDSSRLSVYLLPDNTDGFYGLPQQADIPNDIFSSFGLSLGEFDPNAVRNGNLQIQLNQVSNTVSNDPCLGVPLPFQFADGSRTTLAPAVLQFMDRLGSSPSIALGFNSKGFSFDSLSLLVICRAYTGPAGGKVFFSNSGNLHPPVFEPVPEMTALEGQEIDFTLEANDADNDTLFYYALNLPTGAVLSGNQFTWTPSWTQAGVYCPRFIVSDGKTSDYLDVYLTVLNSNQPPILSLIANQFGQERKLLTFPLVAEDPDGDPVSISVQNLPYGAVFQSNRFYWIPSVGQTGRYEVSFTASDGTLQTQQTVTIVILPDSTQPGSYFFF